MLNHKILLAFLSVIFAFSNLCSAEDGQPIAIRHWPGGGFTVESMWNLHVGVGLNENSKAKLPRPVDAELESLPGLAGASCLLYREANGDKVQLTDEYQQTKQEGMVLCISKEYETREHRDARPVANTTEVLVDGMGLLFLDHDRMTMERRLQKIEMQMKVKDAPVDEDKKIDLVIVATGEQFTAEFCKNYSEAYQPVLMIVNSSIKKVGDADVEAIAHNTLAVSSSKDRKPGTRFVSLGTKPYEMSGKLKSLFDRKEVTCTASREMFAKLSVEQMNFKPSNGSHTPRWNAEHMMGRELVFFSQIYNAIDPSIPVMDLNPKQMPPDYVFAHPDWTGAEEARQMKRVQDFTRRFAYCLDGMDLNKKAPGSRFWTPRALLLQMERHYNEHSANVVKKMELDGWPSDKK